MHAVRVSATGGPEALEYVEIDKPRLSDGEALVRIEAIGLNFVDVYYRTGRYKLATPFTPGSEAAGVVEEVAPGVTSVKPGDRVVYAMVPGAYAEYAAVPAAKLVIPPEAIDSRTAAAAMLQGTTAHYLVDGSYTLRAGNSALVHAAAGGVGGLLVQMAKQRGAIVIATASTTKLDLVREYDADHVIDYTKQDFKEEVMRITNGRGVDVAYDSVGKTTFDSSLDCVAPRGYLVLYGASSGPVDPVAPERIAKNSIFFTRPTLGHYLATREELEWRAGDVLSAVASGKLRLRIDREIPLKDAAEAHRLLESRATRGKVLLIP